MSVPFISKDEIKEFMFDGLGWNDREWSKKIGLASYDSLYCFFEALLRANIRSVFRFGPILVK